jgi:hypothetical protein
MEKTLYLQSESTTLELKHHDDNDTFSLNFLTPDGNKYLSSYLREEFEELGEAIEYLLKGKANATFAKMDEDFSEEDIMNAVDAVKLSREGKISESEWHEDKISIQPVPEGLWNLAHAYVDTGL